MKKFLIREIRTRVAELGLICTPIEKCLPESEGGQFTIFWNDIRLRIILRNDELFADALLSLDRSIAIEEMMRFLGYNSCHQTFDEALIDFLGRSTGSGFVVCG